MIFQPEIRHPLTGREREMRADLVYYFNPVLKYILYSRNPYEFARFGFNSCRQTAIFGAAYLRTHYPEYTFKVFEGDFDDIVDGKEVSYTHAFIIAYITMPASQGVNRSILIDISRTTRPFKFQIIEDWGNVYNRTYKYKNCRMKSMHELFIDPITQKDEVEYLTQLPPAFVCELIERLTAELHTFAIDDVRKFYTTIYDQLTGLKESEVGT